MEKEEITLRVNNEHQLIETIAPNTTDTLHHTAITPVSIYTLSNLGNSSNLIG